MFRRSKLNVSRETFFMPKIFTSEKQKIGKLGEDIACRFLVKHKFSVICQNYTKKWGELDIVAEKDKKLHFIEVKSMSVVALATLHTPFFNSFMQRRIIEIDEKTDISHETDSHRPEENI